MQTAVMEARALQVLVIAGVKACREALVAALNGCERIRAYGKSIGDEQICDEIEQSRPEVIVVDVSMTRGLETIALLRSKSLGIPVIAFGVQSDTMDILVCAEAGAAGYVLADASLDELVAAIDDVLSGRLACPPKIAFDLFRIVGTNRPSQRMEAADFTPREQQVLQLLGNGQSNKEIARSLGIAVSTVKNHVHHILEKSDASSRRHAARKSPFMLAPSAGQGPREEPVPSLLRI